MPHRAAWARALRRWPPERSWTCSRLQRGCASSASSLTGTPLRRASGTTRRRTSSSCSYRARRVSRSRAKGRLFSPRATGSTCRAICVTGSSGHRRTVTPSGWRCIEAVLDRQPAIQPEPEAERRRESGGRPRAHRRGGCLFPSPRDAASPAHSYLPVEDEPWPNSEQADPDARPGRPLRRPGALAVRAAFQRGGGRDHGRGQRPGRARECRP